MQPETQKVGKPHATKAPAVAEKKEIAVSADFAAGGWDTEVADTKDLIIPKVLLMHGSSDLVKKGKRNIGEIIKSTDETVLAKRGEAFEVVVFAKWKEWRIMKKNVTSGRFEYDRLEPWTPENDSLPWDYDENGEVMRRDKTMNFYGVLASEAATGKAFPIKLSFTRTGFRAGGKIADAYERARMEKQPPTRQVFKVGAELIEGKEESYFAFTVEAGASATPTQMENALYWRQQVNQAQKTNTVRDHEVDEPVPTSNAGTSEF